MILHEKEINFKSLEQTFFKTACNLACNELKQLLQTIDRKLMKERDKKVYRHKGHHKTTIKTLMGNVEFSRAIYQVLDGSSSKKHIYLLDEALGFDMIGMISSSLAEKIAENACVTSYKNTAKNVSDVTAQSISHQTAWNVVQKLGSKIAEQEEDLTNQYKQGKVQGEREIKVLFEEADGVYINLQGKDRKKKGKSSEMKLAIFYEGWEKTGKNRYELFGKNVISGFDTASNFQAKKEAKIASIYNIDEVEKRFLNGDGAAWIKNGLTDETHFQLDPYHRNKAILQAVKNKEQRKTIFMLLNQKDVKGCFEYIEALINSIEDEEQISKLESLHKYLSDNKNGLIPYKDRGLNIPEAPLGLKYRTMGTMEHNVDGVIAQRMKGRRANWSIEGATNLSKLLCAKASKNLNETVEGISKTVLPKSVTKDVVSILSASKAPKVDGSGYEGRVCPRPFENANMTNGRRTIKRVFDLKTLNELSF